MNTKVKGVLCIMSSAFCFACMSAFVRAAGDLPSIQKSVFRNAVAMLFALIILLRSRTSIHVDRELRLPLIARSVCGTVGILCNFYTVDHLLLSDATMLNKLSPFFAIIFSWMLLREKISGFQGICIVTAFIGSLFIVKPGLINTPWIPAMIGVLGAVGAGSAYTFVRYLGTHGMKGPVIVFYFSAFSCLVVLPVMLLNYVPMTLQQTAALLMAGLSAAGGQFSVTAAYTFAPAGDISIYDYTQVIFSALIGLCFFGQFPDGFSFLGYIIICGTSIVMFLHNKKAVA